MSGASLTGSPSVARPAAGPLTGPHALSTPRLLLALLRPRRRPLAVALALSAVESVPALLSGLLVAAAVDHGFLAERPGVGLAFLGLLAAVMSLKAVATRVMLPVLAEVVEPLRDDLVRAVVTATVTRAATGAEPPDTAAVNRLTAQVETLRNLVSALLRSSRQLGVSLIAALVGLLALSPPAAAIAVGPMLLALAVFAWLLRTLTNRQRALILADERLTAEVTPILAGIRDVAACGAHDQARATVDAAVSAQVAATMSMAWAGIGRRLIVTLGVHLPLLVLLIAARPLVDGGHLSAGEVIGAVTYLATGLDPALRMLVNSVGGWGVALAVSLRRIAESITVPASSPSTGRTPVRPLGYALHAERLTFGYAPEATPVVRDLDLTIPERAHLAVVGPSGAGKSTLSMLLTGLLTPAGGRILLGGLALEETPEHRLRTAIALVPQEAYVFTGTVRENLAYLTRAHLSGGEAWGTDARLRAAATAVGALPLVERLGGLDALIEEPSSLSAGERQLIALARVHASPARIVVLDEATCHLDPAAEQRAEEAFAERDGTLIVIAHRISSAMRAQRVLLMDGSTTITGTHPELLTRSPLYADLVGHWRGDARLMRTACRPARHANEERTMP
ncbi:ABC transporter ATP-binding protein [Planotetraspora thailandica]|uniref:ABC transporter ATP-binding protein n=1 Tax=Planotetraspora thailandica TaxID=487172 RepID=A0A8J3UYB7_9ACTN|nr:ABC transporter ATP-binding protein [Planotetraspora thailandica]GII54294.1 ABC transporter ATP-binding protein [Planotetraspora thailandica]